jgi:hypothetical protein
MKDEGRVRGREIGGKIRGAKTVELISFVMEKVIGGSQMQCSPNDYGVNDGVLCRCP